MDINHYINKLVFVTGYSDSATATDEVRIFEDIGDVNAYLNSLIATEDYEIRVLHGWLTNAKLLLKVEKKVHTYLLITDEDTGYGIIYESTSNGKIKQLAVEIEKILSGNYGSGNEKEVDEDKEGTIISNDIENIFVVYGYEIYPVIQVNEDDIDEEHLPGSESDLEIMIEKIKTVIMDKEEEHEN